MIFITQVVSDLEATLGGLENKVSRRKVDRARIANLRKGTVMLVFLPTGAGAALTDLFSEPVR